MFTSKGIILRCGFRENNNLDNSQLRGAEVDWATEMSPFSFSGGGFSGCIFSKNKKFPFCEFCISLHSGLIKWKEYLQKAP